MKIIHGTPGMGAPLNEENVKEFLSRKMNIQLATINDKSKPNIQPTWFYFDEKNENIYITTAGNSKKTNSIRQKPDVYFSVDEDNFPYWCVKGSAIANIVEDPSKNVPIVEKIATKYLGGLDDSFAKTMVDMAKNKESVVLELKPKFFSTWDFSKM